jgi:WD40 repeat protein
MFTPNFIFETINGRIIVSGADPDAFVDLYDIKKKKVYRVRETGTEGSIYGTFWLSDISFVVYGMESDETFVEVYDIKTKTKKSYTIDKSKRKPDADLDAFLIAKYGQTESYQSR